MVVDGEGRLAVEVGGEGPEGFLGVLGIIWVMSARTDG